MVEVIKNQLPPAFENWTELYFYTKKNNSGALQSFSLSYLDFIRNENYTIEVRYFEKQVLQEVLSVLPSKKTVICAINELKRNTPFFISEVNELETFFEILP